MSEALGPRLTEVDERVLAACGDRLPFDFALAVMRCRLDLTEVDDPDWPTAWTFPG